MGNGVKQEGFDRVVRALADARSIVVMTGAGASAESGIPTFRDALEGHWSKFDPGELATPQAFRRDPALVSKWYDERRQGVLECEPNAGHFALARLEEIAKARGARFTLLTQNVDQLHQRAGSRKVVEVHGSIVRWRCTETGETSTELEVPLSEYPKETAGGGYWRPDVVWFGEPLPEDALEEASTALASCDVYMCVGTSGVVYPAAGFIVDAMQAGALTVELNLSESALTSEFDVALKGRSGELLPELVEAIS